MDAFDNTDWSWLSSIGAGGNGGDQTAPDFSGGGGGGVDVGADPGGGSGNSGWTINDDGTATGPDGNRYNLSDGTPVDPNAPGQGTTAAGAGGSTPSTSGFPQWLKDLAPWLGLLGTGAGAVLSNQATKKATAQQLAAIQQSNAAINSAIGPGSASSQLFTPYTNLGASAAAALPGLGFKPMSVPTLGSGAGVAGGLGNQGNLGAATLAQIMQQRGR